MGERRFRIAEAASAADVRAAMGLFEAYAASIGVDLGYQAFAAELATLPGKYAPPAGALLLARDLAGHEVGCVGLRPIDGEGACEMKRLYVAPAGRGSGVGRALVDAALGAAARLGYREMRLDTLPSMGDAQRLYRKAGFVGIAPYYDTPIAGTIFMARGLI